MSLQLRPYQAQALEEIDVAFREYRKVMLCLPTGAGKGWMLGVICDKYTKQRKRILVLSTRCEIMMQNVSYVEDFGVSVAYVNPKVKECVRADVVVAMAQTLKRRIEQREWQDWVARFDLVVVDEAQEQTSDFIHGYIASSAWVLGLSGSPQRYGQQTQLGKLYNCIVETTDIPSLIGQGYLSSAKLYSVVAPSLDDVAIDYNSGEYNQKQLAKKFESKTLYKGVVSEWMRLCRDLKTIVFCVSSEQAVEVTKEFCDNGISAKYVLSGSFESDEMYSGERDEVFEQFRRGDIQVLVNVGVAVAGVNIPTIECVVQNFATTSLCKHLQSLGRGSRVTDTKRQFVVLDCGQNYKRLGRYEDKRQWCLWHDTVSGNGVMQLKLCDPTKKDRNGKYGCNEMVPSTCTICPSCGKILVDKAYDYQCHLEEVAANTENDIERWCVQRKLEGWSMQRILIQLCLSNTEHMKEAFVVGYMAMSGKSKADANKYWFVFRKTFHNALFRPKKEKSEPASQLF